MRALENTPMEPPAGPRWIPAVLAAGLTACSTAAKAPLADASDPYQYEFVEPPVRESEPVAAEVIEPARPSAAGAFRRTALAHPTGDPATSALLLERVTPVEVESGGELAYQMRLTNLTELALEEVELSETVDSDFAFLASDPAPTSVDGGVLRWRFGRLGPREQRRVQVRGTVGRGPELEHFASVAYRPLLRAVVRVDAPDLRLHLTAPTDADWCEPIPVRLTVTNTGAEETSLLRLRLELPEGLATETGVATVDRHLAPLGAGESRAELVELVAGRPGTYHLRATVGVGEGGSAPSNTVVLAVRAPELGLAIESDERVYLGKPVRYRITARNTGNGAARRALVELALPPGTSFLSASDGGRLVGDEVRWTIDRLHAGAEMGFDVSLLALVPGAVTGAAELRAACGLPARAEASSEVLALPDLDLDVTDTADPARLGESVTYVLRVTNRGAGPARDVSVSVRLDPALELVETTGPSPATAVAGDLGFGVLSELGPGAEARWRVVVRGVEAGERELAARLDAADLALPVDRREATDYYE